MERKKLRNTSIYSVFVRNYSPEGKLQNVTSDLERIKDMGFDIVWLLPVHPIGEDGRKGRDGSPYAIKDFYSVNPELGTEDDLRNLIDKAHYLGLKVMMDVVYHHTSRDSVLLHEHPDWFYRDSEGKAGNKIGDWSDIYDLDYSKKELWDYLLGALRKWADLGADGFRCDVAPMIPLDFWKYVSGELEKEGHDLIWFSESVEPQFLRFLRKGGHTAHSDGELYEVFQLLYDYDIKDDFIKYIEGRISLEDFLYVFIRQDYIYREDYVKVRFLENHDNKRAAELIPDRRRLFNFTAFSVLLKGAFLFYNGQETLTDHYTDLFTKDTIEWNIDEEYVDFVRNLLKIKKMEFMASGSMDIEALSEDTAEITYEYKDEIYKGVFNLGKRQEPITYSDEWENLLPSPEDSSFIYSVILRKKINGEILENNDNGIQPQGGDR